MLLVVACGGIPAQHQLPARTLRVVIVGDSLAHGAGDETGKSLAQHLDEELTRLQVAHEATVDLAVNGSRTWDVARVLRATTAGSALKRADVVVLSIGGNDLYGDSLARLFSSVAPRMMIRSVVGDVGTIVEQIEQRSAARIVLLSLYDPYRNPKLDADVNLWSSRLFERFHDDNRVQVITIADLFVAKNRLSRIDHFHPGAEANAAIARRIAEAL